MSQTVITTICNMSLGHLGVNTKISNYLTDRSSEAKEFRTFYPITKTGALRDFAWPFATKIEALQLFQTDPNTEWKYGYQYPAKCDDFKRILSGMRNDTRQSRIPYRIIKGSQGKLILSDLASAYGEYTTEDVDESLFPADFILALSWRLAAYVAPVVTGGDPFGLGAKALQGYFLEISNAEANALNEEQSEEDPDSEFIRARS